MLQIVRFFIKTTYLCLVLRISTHIERLLSTNDCVIIPEFGGFVFHSSSAVYESDIHKFCPPHKEIVFNPTLIHQDGLLPESYIQMYGMTFNKAQIALKKDVEELYYKIEQEGAVYFEKIGLLRKSDDGKIVFEPDPDSVLLGLKPYGLFPFHLPPIAQTEQKESHAVEKMTRAQTTVYLPVNRALIRAIGVSVAAACFILFVSIPIHEVDRASYSASFIPAEMAAKSEYLPTDTLQVTGLEVDTTNEKAVSEEITRSFVTETMPVAQTEAQNPRIYYAIIGSFVTEKQANQYMQDIKMPELTDMGILINEGRVRVYAGKFDDRKEAENYIKFIKENEKLKDTWLFVGR